MKTKTFSRLFSFMKGYRALYVVGVVGFALLLLAFQVQIALLFLALFNAIQVGEFTEIVRPIIRFSIMILVLIAVIPLFSYLKAKAAIYTTGEIRRQVFNKLSVLPIKRFKETHSAELSSVATNDIVEVEKVYDQLFFVFAIQLINGVGAGIVMFFIEWRLAIVALIAGMITFITNILYAKRLRSVSRSVQDHLGSLNTKLSNILAGLNVIRVFNIQRFVLKIFDKSNQDTYKVSKTRVKRQAAIDALNTLVFSISFAGITLIGGFLVLEGIIMLGVIVAVVQLQNNVLELVQGLGRFITNMQASLAAGDRIFELLDSENEPESYVLEGIDVNQDTTVKFKEIAFGYDDNRVVDDLTFEVSKGQMVAIVGPSGGGKSTIFKLIMHFFEPQKGSIALAGNTTSHVPLGVLRERIAYVPQDAYLFNTTIKENLRFAKEDASDEEIIRAAKAANAHDFIEELDHKYETIVGEQGTKLSGGQRQRVAIARAILKDAPLLLLDEATSALDSESETLVQDAIHQLKKNRTTLVIAHRLSTIKDADKILVIKEGKIFEEGTHESLLNTPDSLYAKLYNTKTKLEEA